MKKRAFLKTKRDREAFVFFIKEAGTSLINLFKVVAPELQKFDTNLREIGKKTSKIRNKSKPVQQDFVVAQVSEKPKTQEEVKSELKVL